MNFSKTLENVKAYEAGKPIELVVRDFGIDESKIVKLASNENPYGVSPKVKDVLRGYVDKAYMYPDDSFYELKELLAKKYNLTSKNVVIGAGSDQVIEFCIHVKAKDKKVLVANTTFAMYEIYAKVFGAEVIKTKDDMHNLEQFLEMYHEHKPDIIFLCLPNNPLGECLDKKDVFEFISKIDSDTLVVVDGAYQEYASFKDSAKKIDPKELIDTFPNAIYLGTFSKAFALGGMRVGYGLADENIIKTLHKVRPPFNITTLSLKSAITALGDEEFVNYSIEQNFIEMKRYEEFAKANGFNFIDSYTNFITLLFENTKFDSTVIADELLKRGVIIRNLKSYGLNAIRVTIGSKVQNDRFFEEFETLIK
ncbi:MAG: histidinol-phosphate transaminase [Campylobacterales bacterium]|nr:histidinol-phosphate transaminase [Campylobacterales bacterium]